METRGFVYAGMFPRPSTPSKVGYQSNHPTLSPWEVGSMKTFCVVLFLLLTTTLFAQSVLNNEPVLIQPLSHPQRAVQTQMGQEQNVLETHTYTYGKGE